MNWFVLALISSITLSLREVVVKKAGKELSSAFMSWGLNFFMFLIFLALNVICLNYHVVTLSFVWVLMIAATLDSLATVLYLWAIKTGDLSKIIPMLCFIPVIQLFVTPILIHENLSLMGIAGVLVVVCGSYILNIETRDGFLSPIKSVFKDKSSMTMLAVACIWGVSSSFHKMGVNQTNALFWGASEIGLISLFLFPFAVWSDKGDFSFLKLKKTLWPALFSTLTVLSYYTAISLGPVAYVSSVRRLGVLFSMVIGIVVLKEKLNSHGFAGGIIMITGACIISLFG
ncbi:MAG: DMT family transporter [Proteobacteria bacterium]|nr:DMT family transporter [Pseudomonadota bacterium]MBU1583621.1 DMT family transporter [Pseudomonadota bacterium]MBU2454237.1 DMT family transporter [Pseudomonadota bacterium]MBU2629733.1 DMT family transporter [Pseudomonadota bacterium]